MAILGSILGRIWSTLAPILLPFVWQKIENAVKGYLERQRADQAVASQAQANAAQSEHAETPQEREEAADATRRGL